VKLNAGRNVTGVLRGYDQFMNVVLDHSQGCDWLLYRAACNAHTRIGTAVRGVRGCRGRRGGWGDKTRARADAGSTCERDSSGARASEARQSRRTCVPRMRTCAHALNDSPHTFDGSVHCVMCAEHVVGSKTEKNEIGMVVVRGNSISMIECVDKVFG